jgi:D-tyrosyl-tRNA(Tyr) deacylase
LMRVVLQRVSRAEVRVEGSPVGKIGLGFLLLVGVGRGDGPETSRKFATKIAGLRIFADEDHKMNRSLADVGGEILAISQFTLYGDVRRGRRPSWIGAEDPEPAAERVEELCRALEEQGIAVARGVFGAHMEVELTNDGPVTLILDSADT